MEHGSDITLLEKFRGKVCARTVACNSIKIAFGHKSEYIWIEPPWIFAEPGRLITTSDEYPQEDSDFVSWSEMVDIPEGSSFVEYSYNIRVLVLHFSNAKMLIIPESKLEEGTEEWDHWYAASRT